jgi:hypothetical protein
MKERYTTVQCLNVKTCIVRKMCSPSSEYTLAFDAICKANPGILEELKDGNTQHNDARTLLNSLPPRWSDNVRGLVISRTQMVQCKQLAARNAMYKNSKKIRVQGRKLVECARAVLRRIRCAGYDGVCETLVVVSFALMLTTGRRTCEVLNGNSSFVKVGPYAVEFDGVAKRRGKCPSICIPTLAPADDVLAGIEWLRIRQMGSILTNKETSLRYQSLLGRSLSSDPLWKDCKCVHGIRGVYVCAALRVFQWGEPTDAYIAMCILGHAGLKESLVYTTFHLGDDFHVEPNLGAGQFTPFFTDEGEESIDSVPL